MEEKAKNIQTTHIRNNHTHLPPPLPPPFFPLFFFHALATWEMVQANEDSIKHLKLHRGYCVIVSKLLFT